MTARTITDTCVFLATEEPRLIVDIMVLLDSGLEFG
jgi:hypothetical protein